MQGTAVWSPPTRRVRVRKVSASGGSTVFSIFLQCGQKSGLNAPRYRYRTKQTNKQKTKAGP